MDKKIDKKTKKSSSHSRLIKDISEVVGQIDGKIKKKLRTNFDNIHSTSTVRKIKPVSLEDLTKESKIDKSTLKIKKSLKCAEKPLPDFVLEKKHKRKNFKDMTKVMDDWQPIVTHYKNAKELKFPLNQQDVSEVSVVDWVNDSNTEELKLKNVENMPLMQVISSLDPKEKNILNKLNLQQELNKRKYLSQFHTFLEKYAKERKRIRKIKSKGYHRILKKKEQKALKDINLDDMKSTNPEIYEEELKKLEKLRSEERARLKHKGGSKWKRNILVKGSRDPEVRKALIEQANIAKTLTEDCKHMSETESEIEDEDCIKIEDDNVLNEKIKILSDNKWFKESEKDLEKFKTRYFSAFPNDDKNTQFSTNEPAKECETKIKSKINIDKKFDFSKADDELLGVTNENELNNYNDIAEAFQDDDAIAEFVEENREEEESEDDMLGWGQWVTPEILSQPKPKVEKNDIQTNVILNIQNTAIKKLQPSYIPEKYKEEYLKNLKQPIGPEWNTFSKFNSNIKPRIQTLPGVPIPPLDADEKCDDETIKMKNMIKSLPLKIRETLLSKI